MTDREEATRDALVREIESERGLLCRFGYAEQKRLKENVDPAFIEEKRAEAEQKSRNAWAALAVPASALLALLVALYVQLSRGRCEDAYWLLVPSLMFLFVLANSVRTFWKWRKRRIIYRALHALTAGEKRATV
jgi:hypothetical protein